jgi:hypothetical protein
VENGNLYVIGELLFLWLSDIFCVHTDRWSKYSKKKNGYN